MSEVIVKFKIVPENPQVEMHDLKTACEKAIADFGDTVDSDVEPLAFGMNALILKVVMEEGKGGVEPVEHALADVQGVGRAESVDVRKLM